MALLLAKAQQFRLITQFQDTFCCRTTLSVTLYTIDWQYIDMDRGTDTIECVRCGTNFAYEAPHTELVRRDFQDYPRPAVVEYLCEGCWRAYVEEFLGDEFERDIGQSA